MAYFARGLYADLEIVKQSQFKKNLVFSYHFMSHFYTHDALINNSYDGNSYSVFREIRGDDSLYLNLNTIVQSEDPYANRAVFCILPYELGPDSFSKACNFTNGSYFKAVDVNGKRARIIGFFPKLHLN